MTKINVINLCFICLMLLTGGCINFPSNPDLNSNDNNLVKIIYPASNDSIGIGITRIEYSLSTPWSLKFMELYINGTFTGNFPPNQDGSKPAISFDLSKDLIGTSFSYYLIYYDTNETSAKSNEISNVHVFESVDPPFAPYNLKLIKLSETSLNLSWSDSSLKVDGYEIWRNFNFVGGYQKLMNVGSNVFNINDENLNPTGTYSYKVRGFNKFGMSKFSNEINTIDAGSSGNLYPPTDLVALALGPMLVKLSWKDNSLNENYFVIERRRTNEIFTKVGMVNRDITVYTDSLNGLVAGAEYYYRIKSFSNSDSAWSNEAFVQTSLHGLISPTNLQAINLGGENVALAWSDNDNTNTIFEIERKVSGDEIFDRIATVPGNQNSYLDENLSLNTYYTYRVRSGDGVYYSFYSNEVTIYINIVQD